MEVLDRPRIGGAQTDMHSAVSRDRRHPCTAIDPEFRIFLAETDRGVRPFAQFAHSERRQQSGVERLCRIQIAYRERDMIDHPSPPQFESAGMKSRITPARRTS